MAVPTERQKELRAIAAQAAVDLGSASAQEIVAWAVDTFGERFCISASMADAVMVDLVSRVKPGIDVVFIDTGYHFTETLDTRQKVIETYPVRVRTVEARQSVAEQDATFGPRLHDRDPDACCNLRKVEPLRRAIEPYFAWASGIRRDETENRRDIGVVEWDANRAMVKVNPIAAWTQDDVDRYIDEHDVVVNPLLGQGYPSIGCAPCTRRVGAGEDPRSGRWAGSGKTECGLHADYFDRKIADRQA